MALVGATQPLLAAFSFGIVVNAASAALFLHVSGHGSAIFKDGLRLVLITFLLSAALWAQVAFIATIIDTTTNSMPCQVGVIFSTLFDQLGRFAVEQYLLWAMNTGGKMSIAELIPQLLVVARFVVGMVFVGFSRTQVEPVCVATSSVLPIAIVVIALDGVLIAIFAARAFMTGLVSDVQENNSSASRSKSVLLVMIGFAIWTGTSIAMLLGMQEVGFIVRTGVPAGGLSILILIVTGCADNLVTPRGKPSHPPEAPSPRRINISRDISSSESNDWPPTRYEDLKEHAIRSSTTFMQPREAPRIADDKDELPNISRSITGIAGVGGLPIQGALFPPARTETTITSSGNGVARKMDLGSLKKKRNLFDFGKDDADKAPAGKLIIGNPILQGDNAQNPLNKIATIDLQEAAMAEKERRAMALRRESELIARRPPPPPPSGTPDEGLRRAVSVKRKEVASILSQAALTASNVNQQSRWTATTTSAQLSPGVEEIRRRSPRQSPQAHPEDQESRTATPATPELALDPMPKVEPAPVPEQVMELAPVPAPVPKPARAEKKRPPVPMPQPSAVRPAIRPSRMRPPSPKEEPAPEPATVLLQRRPTNGLPGNPKARGLKLVQEAGNQNQQTVMFVNNIVYDDPTGVQNIIEGATDKASRTQGKGAPARSASVVNRPRPIPRKLERESQDLSNHRRSRSGGSLVSRKSILMSNPGSPGQLPPLPPPPKSAGSGVPSRPHPNNTKSMTVDEKMTLFFPSPPSGSMKQKTLAPIVPPIPNSFLESNHSPTSTDDYNRRSNRTTRTSAKTDDVLSVDEIPVKDLNSQSRRSPEVYQDIADEVRSSWMAENSNRQTQRTESSSGDGAGKRASSPLLPPIRSSAWTESTDTRTHDTMMNWDSVHSPEVAVGVQVSRRVAKATDVSRSNSRGSSESQEVAFMLDASAHDDMGRRGTWFLDDDSLVDTGRSSPSQWHRRVGDECPTFSGRKEQVRSRKMPPPTPLRLRAGSSKNAVVIQAAEPSPIESPKQAIEQIQAQLKKLDHPNPNRDSTESQVRRLALLENLEMEMGMQEDRWHEMQHDIGRDSISSLKTTSPNRNSRRESLIGASQVVPDASARNSIALERRQSRRARMRNSITISKPTEEPVANPDKARVSVWQQRLAEAQMEYNDNVADKNRRSVNFLAVSLANLGSPTPPESDESDEDTRLNAVATRSARGQKSLWKPEARAGPRSAGMLWTPSTTPTKKSNTALPGPSFRAAPRKQIEPLPIHSTQLWTKPHNTKTRATGGGLWRPAWVAAQPSAEPQRTSKSELQMQSQKAPRPLTQRPPRRNKRVTLLPDIVENPEPLPDKRGTLGIFQFPWGERSDTASVQPTRSTMVMAMPGTMTSGGQSKTAQAHEHRARQLESAEYSSSFFDDYDDEDQDQDSDFEGDDSDDDFDETTLWEIANLLKSDSVPSKLSLLPPRHPNPVVDDYMNDIPSDDDYGSSSRQSIVIGLEEERAPSEEPRDSVLWNGPSGAQTADHGKGLPHPDDKTWEAYGGNVETARAKPRMAAEPATIESDSLWAPGSDKHEDASSSSAPMWAAKGTPAKESKKAQGQVAGDLWIAPAISEEPAESQGMFKLSPNRSEYRSTTKEPAAQNMTRTPRPSTSQPLDRLTSTAMWSKTSGHKARFQQLSHGLWDHPASPEHTETEGMFIVDRSRSAYRTTAKEPAAKDMQRKPRPTEQKPLDNLESTNLWAVETTTSTERNWITGKSVSGPSVPARHRYRRTVAYRVDWEAALLEAIKASYRRKTATEVEWAAALEEAIELGSRSTFNAAARHPVFAASSMGSAPAQDSHPAATGYSTASTAAPVAPVAPVATFSDPESDMIRAQIEALEQERLFAQQAAQEVISRLSMHPAPAKEPANEEPPVPAAPAPATTLWSQPGSMFRKAAAAMWTAQPAAPVVEVPAPEPDKLESVRRKEKRREEILARIAAIEAPEEKEPAFAEQALWNGGEEKSEQKDWLDETKEKTVAKRTSGVVLRY